jgi:hypothetical protein
MDKQLRLRRQTMVLESHESDLQALGVIGLRYMYFKPRGLDLVSAATLRQLGKWFLNPCRRGSMKQISALTCVDMSLSCLLVSRLSGRLRFVDEIRILVTPCAALDSSAVRVHVDISLRVVSVASNQLQFFSWYTLRCTKHYLWRAYRHPAIFVT